MQLPREVLAPEMIAKLKAIAWDRDHLIVPDKLKPYAASATKAVAALKNSRNISAKIRCTHCFTQTSLGNLDGEAFDTSASSASWVSTRAQHVGCDELH